MSVFKQIKPMGVSIGGWMPQNPASLANGEEAQLRLDTAGNLIVRSAVFTDEKSDIQPFAGNSLPLDWTSSIGIGGSVTVSNSKCNIVSGTNAGSKTSIYKVIDYAPLNLIYNLSVSQRIANQDIYFGCGDHPTDGTLDTMFARFHLYGTSNTLISCETQSSSDTGGNEGLNTQILLPLGFNTSQNLHYEIEYTQDKVDFYVGLNHDNMYQVATHSLQLPNPYVIMYQRVRFVNGTTPASSTTVSVDTISSHNMNILDVSGEISGKVDVGQTVVVSTVNSSTTNLSASPSTGYIFVGLPEPTLNVADLQISLKASENCIVYVEQSQDATNWDISDSFNYNHLKPEGFGVNVQAISSYYRVRVENLSTINATTYFRLQSILCPIAEPLPRAVSDEGNLKVGIYELEDEFGQKGQFSQMRDLKVSQAYRLVGTSFGSAIDTAFWTALNSGTGSSSTVGNSISTLSSGTSSGGYGQMQSVRVGRFIFAHPHLYRSIVRINNMSVSGNIRRWGAFTTTGVTTPNDGFYFELSSSNVLSCVCSRTGTPTSVSSGSFNGNINEFVMDTNAHAYEISFFLGSAIFMIDGVLVHTFRPTTTMLSNNFTLPVTATTINTGTSSGTMEMWAGIILRLGREISAPQYRFTSGVQTAVVAKNGAGTLRKIVFGSNTPAGSMLLYDALTATNQIAAFTWTNNQASTSVEFDLDFYTGLTFSVTGGGSQTIIFE